jgi:hypothetical protein
MRWVREERDVSRGGPESVRRPVSGGAAATYILIGGGRLLYPFIFLVLAFVTLLGLSMRGSGVAPTARKAAP